MKACVQQATIAYNFIFQLLQEIENYILREDLISLAVGVDWIFSSKGNTRQHDADKDSVSEDTMVSDVIAEDTERISMTEDEK